MFNNIHVNAARSAEPVVILLDRLEDGWVLVSNTPAVPDLPSELYNQDIL